MRLLIVTGIFPPDIGGPATYVPLVAEHMAKRGHEVTVVTLSERTEHRDRYPFRVVRIRRGRPKALRRIRVVAAILAHGIDADAIFMNGLQVETALANLLLRKPLLQKVVSDVAWERALGRGWVSADCAEFQSKRYSLRVEMLKRLRTWWSRRCDGILVPSRFLAGVVQAWGVQEQKIRVIYNSPPSVETIAKVQGGSRPPRVVTVGRLIPLKRVDQIIAAVARIDELQLLIVGDGPERARLETLTNELGIASRVFFSGQQSRDATLALMRTADILLLNSTHEGLPHVVLEAMALGLPVIATDAGGTRELVDHERTGLLLPVENPPWVQAIRELLDNESLRTALIEGARNKLAEFRTDEMLSLTEAALKDAARTRPTIARRNHTPAARPL